jgi:hypothetical protein
MANIAASLSIDPPGSIFGSEEDMANRTIADDPLQILIPCSICHESEASIFQTDGEYCLYCWQEITHPKI